VDALLRFNVGLSTDPCESFLIEVDFEGVETSATDVDPEIVFEAVY